MEPIMNETEKLNLKKMITDLETIDNTEQIRNIKHSVRMARDIQTIEKLKVQNKTIKNTTEFDEICRRECRFLYDNYTDIFNKIVKDEIDLSIMFKFLQVLKLIEDEEIDQQEGSVIIGKLLKELYVDSAIRCGENLDKKYPKPILNSGNTISWKQYKIRYFKL